MSPPLAPGGAGSGPAAGDARESAGATRVDWIEHEAHGRRWARLHLSSASGVNPLSSATVATMRERLAAVDAAGHEAPHAVLLSAEGRCFCAGADVKEFRAFDAPAFSGYMRAVLALYAEMVELRRPIVCLVQADARGGGAALALCSDFVVAVEGSRFALPEAHRGLAGGGWLMPRLMGRQRAAEMVLLGREFEAAEMAAMGLVNTVCAADALHAQAESWCAALARMPESAFAVGKRSLAGGLSVGLREAMQWHVEAQTRAFEAARAVGRL
jgi:2-(1,2-epoxy-1,2-dihydrophenyl)acetyl-CoA isomerase